ncbi:MAG TPA: formimidoylglutamase [Cryomorphaceae bacterium]|nr:formimidoylglutamase [Cryomorphaceae bacterium]
MSWVDDISYFFSPLEGILSGYSADEGNKVGNLLRIHGPSSFPDLEGVKFAIVGVKESRRSDFHNQWAAPDAVRLKLYELFSPSDGIIGADLGNIEPGETPEDTDAALKQVIANLTARRIPAIVLGGTQELTFAIHQGYEALEVPVNHTIVDNKIDLGEFRDQLSIQNYLSKIVLHDPSYLFNLTVLGYHTYYADPEVMQLMDKMYFEAVRIGEIKSDPAITEPLIRNSDMISIDMMSVKNEAAPGTFEPNGFDGESICRIARYSGMSDKVSTFGVFNYNVDRDPDGQQATLIAQMIWYFVEGLLGRVKEFPLVKKQNFLEYKVQLPEYKEDLVFFKSKRTDKWWMKIPYAVNGSKFSERHHLMPCSYEDYKRASQGEMPDLWWKTYRKLG